MAVSLCVMFVLCTGVQMCHPAVCLCFYLPIFQTLTSKKETYSSHIEGGGSLESDGWMEGGRVSHTRPISAE